jgi:hypothetical protein
MPEVPPSLDMSAACVTRRQARSATVGTAPLAAWLLAAVGLLLPAVALAQPAKPGASSAGGIYSCIDDRGRKLTSDRPIPECTAKEQRVLNSDGSLRQMHPPTLTVDERAAKEAAERRAAEARAAQADAARRDRNLMSRFRDEAAHTRAREAALDSVRAAIRASELRQQALTEERRPLSAEAEFYKGRALPPKLKQQLDANDAAADAQRAAGQTQQAELERVSRLYDIELERLRRLWAGAAPGSLGNLPSASRPVSRPATPSASAAR